MSKKLLFSIWISFFCFLLSKAFLSFDNAQQFFLIIKSGEFFAPDFRLTRYVFQAPLLLLGKTSSLGSYNQYLFGIMYALQPLVLIWICAKYSKGLPNRYLDFSLYSIYLICLPSYYHLLGRPSLFLFIWPLFGVSFHFFRNPGFTVGIVFAVLSTVTFFAHQLSGYCFVLVGALLIFTTPLSKPKKFVAGILCMIPLSWSFFESLGFLIRHDGQVTRGVADSFYLLRSLTISGNYALLSCWIFILCSWLFILSPKIKKEKEASFFLILSFCAFLFFSHKDPQIFYLVGLPFRHFIILFPSLLCVVYISFKPINKSPVMDYLPLLVGLFLLLGGFHRGQAIERLNEELGLHRGSCFEIGKSESETGPIAHWSVNFEMMIYQKVWQPQKCIMLSCEGNYPRDMDRHLRSHGLPTKFCTN